TMNAANTYKRSLKSGAVTLFLMLGLAGFAPATLAQDASNSLESIEVASLPGDQVQLRLRMSNRATEPRVFTIKEPARIAVDLANTNLALDSRRTEIGIGSVRNAIVAEAQGTTRLVINLANMIDYDTRTEGNSVFITLGNSGAASAAITPTQTSGSVPVSTGETQSQSKPRGRSITGIDFRRGKDGEGRIFVSMTDPKTVVDMKQEAGKLVLEFKNVSMPEDLIKRYDVVDFATPVTTIDAMRRGSDVRVTVNAQGDYEHLAYQVDKQFAVEFKPVVEEETASIDPRQKEYTGERLNLNFQDIETRALLQIIAEFTGKNIVVSDSVSGNVTLRLNNVPWDQALDIILRTKGLDMRENGDVILVAPAQEIAEMEKIELEAREQVQKLEPLRSEFIQVNYAKASELAALISSGGDQGHSILSERGSLSIDQRTNTLLVRDTEDNLADVRRLINHLDVPVKQVLIESRIVIANDNFNRELGARLGYSGVNIEPNGRDYVTSGDSNSARTLANSINDGQPGLIFPGSDADSNALNVDLPVGQPAGSIALAVLGNSYVVDLELSALEAEGDGEVVSSPRLVTANQKEASIRQGVEIPYQEASASGATATQFKEAVLELTVTPQITPDERVIMDLTVSNDTVGEEVASATGGFVPSIDKREIQTQVLVNNGDTVVLGGIYETSRSKSERKVPLLGDLPGLGFLFRSKTESNDKRELLIFVTPKILDDRLVLEE
ncbi:MAG: type IV pilus secretin PilQ, partial [Gammaproteobacteria bacterium]|nr:type IV pilus secretin PilQ [Gammaproteobacteria bacterium]